MIFAPKFFYTSNYSLVTLLSMTTQQFVTLCGRRAVPLIAPQPCIPACQWVFVRGNRQFPNLGPGIRRDSPYYPNHFTLNEVTPSGCFRDVKWVQGSP